MSALPFRLLQPLVLVRPDFSGHEAVMSPPAPAKETDDRLFRVRSGLKEHRAWNAGRKLGAKRALNRNRSRRSASGLAQQQTVDEGPAEVVSLVH